jgi:transketolase
MRRVPGADFSSGSSGHGLSVAVGMAMAARVVRMDEVRIWALLGDQELNEGQIWEAAQTASHFELGNLCAIVDRNEMGLDGRTEETMAVDPIEERFQAFGWSVVTIDGHDPQQLFGTLKTISISRPAKPTCVVAQTVKGKGIRYMEHSRLWHLGYLAPADAAPALEELESHA